MEEIVKVNLEENSYPIYIGSENLASIGLRLQSLAANKVRVITNPTVWSLYGSAVKVSFKETNINFDVFEVPDGEEYKSIETAGDVFERLARSEALRFEPIIALGGGVIGDLAGFVAATYMRGVPFVQVPTTLLAQVDSSVGGKVAVNLAAGKNLIGAFYQPKFVLIDVSTLKTLPEQEFKAGLVEVIKVAFLKGGDLLSYLKANLEDILGVEKEVLLRIVKESCKFKAGIVEEDERDLTGKRAILNYGHTVGHAIETLTGYTEYLHGEAVALGMIAAALISHKLGLIDKALLELHYSILRKASFSVTLPSNVSTEDILQAISLDKKRKGQGMVFVLLKDVGQPFVTEVDERIARSALEEMRASG